MTKVLSWAGIVNRLALINLFVKGGDGEQKCESLEELNQVENGKQTGGSPHKFNIILRKSGMGDLVRRFENGGHRYL